MKRTILSLSASLLLSLTAISQPATGLDFDGTDDYVSCGNILPASYTKEAWINLTSLSFFNNIVSSGGTSQHAFWAPASYGSRLSAGHNFTWDYVQDPTPLVAGTWYHVAVTYDAATTTMKLYKDGALVASNNAVPAFAGGNDVAVGGYGSAAVMIGVIDEVRIWNRALCQDEIQHNMSCGLNPTGQNGLTALYHFDQGTVGANNSGITTLTDASGNGNDGTLNNFALNGATSNWATGTVSGTCTTFEPTTLSGTPGGGTVSSTFTVQSTGTYYIAGDCGLVAKVLPSGGSPVSGSVTCKVTIDATVQSYGGSPYVQRHVDVEPAVNASSSTGTVTLYFTQAEFDNYNLARGLYPALPTSPADAVGKADLRITQYHGTGTAPGNYTGPAAFIDPPDGNIVWNSTLSRWEITTDVNGFSGFYVHTSLGGTLPVDLISFNGVSNGQYNKIQWVTSGEINSDHFELERSADGIAFARVAALPAQTNSDITRYYVYQDLKGPSSVYYYRLKMVDRDGSFKYSAIIRISNKQSGLITVYPNPAIRNIVLNVSDTRLLNSEFKVSDMNGKLIRADVLRSLQQTLDISAYSPGVYIIRFADGNTLKFLKQ